MPIVYRILTLSSRENSAYSYQRIIGKNDLPVKNFPFASVQRDTYFPIGNSDEVEVPGVLPVVEVEVLELSQAHLKTSNA